MKGLLLFILLQSVAFAETPNLFNPTKPGTEAMVAGAEGCQKGFEKGRRSLGRWTGSKEDRLLAVYFCACQFDSKRKFPSQPLESHAQECIDDASIKVKKSHDGVPFRLNNIFDSNEYAFSAIQSAFYACEEKESKSPLHKWPKKYGQKGAYCSCLVDYLQDKNDLSLTKYTEGNIVIDSAIEKKCLSFAKTR